MLNILLDQADININSKDVEGRTPIWWAVNNGHSSVVSQLLAESGLELDSIIKSRRAKRLVRMIPIRKTWSRRAIRIGMRMWWFVNNPLPQGYTTMMGFIIRSWLIARILVWSELYVFIFSREEWWPWFFCRLLFPSPLICVTPLKRLAPSARPLTRFQ